MCIFRVRAATAASKRTPSIAQTALRLWQPPQMSFRGAKRRGNPLNRNATQWRLPLTALVLAITNRAENLCYQFEQGQRLLPQFRKIVCLVKRTMCASGIFHNPNNVWISSHKVRYHRAMHDIITK